MRKAVYKRDFEDFGPRLNKCFGIWEPVAKCRLCKELEECERTFEARFFEFNHKLPESNGSTLDEARRRYR